MRRRAKPAKAKVEARLPVARKSLKGGNAARLYNDGQLPPPADPPGDVQNLEAWNKVHWHE